MSIELLKKALDKVVREVFEQTAFMFSEPPSSDNLVNLAETEVLEISLCFHGTTGGVVTVLMPTALCSLLEENMVGENDLVQEESLEQIADAGKEIVNIIVGQLLTELYGDKEVFDLTPPTVRVCSEVDYFCTASSEDTVCLIIEDHPIFLTLVVKEGANEYQSPNC